MLRNAFVGYVMLALVLVTIVAPFVDFRTAWALTPYNIICLVVAVVAGLAVCFLQRLIRSRLRDRKLGNVIGSHEFTAIVLIGCAALLLYQIVLVSSLTLKGYDWDSPLMLNIQNRSVRSLYYSSFPNNYFLGGVFALVDAFARSLRLLPQPVDCLISAALVTVSVGLISFVARKLGGERVGLGVFGVSFVLCGMSPWTLIPYSDSFGIFCPTMVLFAFVCLKRLAVKWSTIIFFAYVGYCIKPTSLFILAAIVLVCGCQWVSARLRRSRSNMQPSQEAAAKNVEAQDSFTGGPTKVRTVMTIVASSILALGLAFAFTTAVKEANGVEIDPEREVSITHFLMMGFNAEAQGMHSVEDKSMTVAEETPEDRARMNMDVWRERVLDMGFGGVAKLMVQKTLINYSSGDFGWAPDGFLGAVKEVEGDNAFFQRFYDIQPTPMRVIDGKMGVLAVQERVDQDVPSVYDVICQVLWMFVLAGIALTLLARRPAKPEMVVAVTLLFLSGFLLLFECSARYLFLYSPYFVLLGVLGWQRLYQRIGASG